MGDKSRASSQLRARNFVSFSDCPNGYKLYHVHVELALQKPLLTHKLHTAQQPNMEDQLFYECQHGIWKIMVANPW